MLGKKTKDQEWTTPQQARSASASDSSTSVISKEMHIDGNCVVEGRIRIEGRITGNVQAAGLELGESGFVKGDLTATEGAKGGRPFVISGQVDGSVRATRVDIAPSGKVLQGVEADEAHVRGRVEGGVLVRQRLVLEETAVVEGDVRARKLALKEGGQVNGTIVMGDRAALDDTEKAGRSGTGKASTSAADGTAAGRGKAKSGGEKAKADGETAKAEGGDADRKNGPGGGRAPADSDAEEAQAPATSGANAK